jgi:mannan endo-1,4-beta-mannosidase
MIMVSVGLAHSFFWSSYFSGGMDVYVRHFGVTKHHDEFYSNQTIIDLFKNYTTQVVSRYINSSAILAWELANDPRFVLSASLSDIM